MKISDDMGIEEIILRAGWNDDSLIHLLLSYIENQGSMDVLRDFLADAAREENEDGGPPPADPTPHGMDERGMPVNVDHTGRFETPAQRDARVGVITQAMADDVDGKGRR